MVMLKIVMKRIVQNSKQQQYSQFKAYDSLITALLYIMIIRCYCYILASTSQLMYRYVLLLLFEPNIELNFSSVGV